MPSATRTEGRRRIGLTVVGILVSAILLVLAFHSVSLSSIAHAVGHCNWRWLVLSLAFPTLSYGLRGLRWHLQLHPVSNVNKLTTVAWTFAGYALNNLLPARAGDIARVTLASRKTRVSVGYAVATLVVERILDAAILIVLLVIGAHFVHASPAWLSRGAAVTTLIIVVAALGFFAMTRMRGDRRKLAIKAEVPSGAKRLLHGARFHLQEASRAVRLTLRGKTFFHYFGITLIIWLLDSVFAITCARAFHLTLPLSAAFLLLAALGLASSIPSTPGYLGVFQFVAVTVLCPLGYARPTVLAFILVFQAAVYFVTLFWAGATWPVAARRSDQAGRPQRTSTHKPPSAIPSRSMGDAT